MTECSGSLTDTGSQKAKGYPSPEACLLHIALLHIVPCMSCGTAQSIMINQIMPSCHLSGEMQVHGLPYKAGLLYIASSHHALQQP